MDDMLDYDVKVTIKFRLSFDPEGEMNSLAIPQVFEGFAEHVRDTFEIWEDGFFSNYINSNLDFGLNFPHVTLTYNFSCHDESPEEAESFAEYVLSKDFKECLTSFGCEITKMTFEAEEADMSWYDEFEARLFGEA